MAHHHFPRAPLTGWGELEEDDVARWRRVIARLDVAACLCEYRTNPHRGGAPTHAPLLPLAHALLIAHDLFMLGHLNTPPTLRWTPLDAEAALRPWHVRVLPDCTSP